jgi:hypothetical protein
MPGTRNVRINLEIDFRILLRLIRFCADLQLTTVRTGLVTLPSDAINLVAPGRTTSTAVDAMDLFDAYSPPASIAAHCRLLVGDAADLSQRQPPCRPDPRPN